MKNIFLSFRFTGEDPNEVEHTMGTLKSIIEENGHTVFCSFFQKEVFEQNEMAISDIYEYCLQKQEESNIVIAFIKSSEPSYGINIELQKAMDLNQKFILLIKEGLAFSDFRSAADQIIEYKVLPELYKRLKALDVSEPCVKFT